MIKLKDLTDQGSMFNNINAKRTTSQEEGSIPFSPGNLSDNTARKAGMRLEESHNLLVITLSILNEIFSSGNWVCRASLRGLYQSLTFPYRTP